MKTIFLYHVQDNQKNVYFWAYFIKAKSITCFVNKLILIVSITFAIAAVSVLTGYSIPSTNALNLSAGDPLEVVAKDLTGYHTGQTFKMDCTVDEKPSPPDNELHLTCIEVPTGDHSQTGADIK